MFHQIITTAALPWIRRPLVLSAQKSEVVLSIGGPAAHAHPWRGFGGCFNELGWEALQGLDAAERAAILEALFGQEGCRFTHCRLPIGASDYALEWYSHNEYDGDLEMAHFSIARDERFLLPYIKAAQAVQPKIEFFASPWSPPTWMKFPRAYNYGTLRWTPEILKAYALYLVKFIKAYAEKGVPIAQLHPQNEPVADQKFPSCLWTGPQMGEFIRDHLVPALHRHGLPVEVYLGTLNTADFNGFFLPALMDAKDAIAGAGLQWAGKDMAQRVHAAFPTLPITQTENECGDGKQTWDYAEHVFSLLRHYIANGASAYVYWNMVLQPGGRSTWGWNQNAMITVDPATKAVVYTHEFYVMKHFASFIAPGARLLELSGALSGNALAFRNTDGSTVLVVNNPLTRSVTVEIAGTVSLHAELPAHSFNTFLLPA
jgi:glucosylceramidase